MGTKTYVEKPNVIPVDTAAGGSSDTPLLRGEVSCRHKEK